MKDQLYEQLTNVKIVRTIQDDHNAGLWVMQGECGKEYVWKKYNDEKACNLEMMNVRLLENSQIKMLQPFAFFEGEKSLFFPLMDGNFYEALKKIDDWELQFRRLTECIRQEISGLTSIREKLMPYSRNGQDPYTYSRNLDVMGNVHNDDIEMLAKDTSACAIVARYDPDIFNYLVKGEEIYSHDFSLWRTAHPMHYLSFFVADCEKMAEIDSEYTKDDKRLFKRIAEFADDFFIREIEENAPAYGVGVQGTDAAHNDPDPQRIYLLNKIESFAYHATWYLKRILAMDYTIHDRDTLKRNYFWSMDNIERLVG